MPVFLIALLLLLPTITPAALQLTYANLPSGQACCLVADPQGNLYVVGIDHSNVSVTKLDAAHRIVATFQFGGGGDDQPLAAALDAQGNLLIAGQTNSTDFPLRNPLFPSVATPFPSGFLSRLDPVTGQLLSSTRIGGNGTTSIQAVTVDPTGNIYVAGSTTAANFPITPDAFQKTGAMITSFGSIPFGFVMKLSPTGDRLLYSTFLGGATANCIVGGSRCINKFGFTFINAIVADRNGIVTVAGFTNASDFPVTPGVVQSVCRCADNAAHNGFITQLNSTGSGLRWSTFLGGSPYGTTNAPQGINIIKALAQDPNGNILVAGYTNAYDFPTTRGALQPQFGGELLAFNRITDGFLAKLNPTATALVFSTFLGGPAADQINHLQLDPQSNIWITGITGTSNTFFALVAADGSRLLANQSAPASAAGQAINLSSNLLSILGPSGAVLRAPAAQLSGVSILGLAGSFEGPSKGQIAPGEFVCLYGNLLGPATGVGAALDGNGRIANQLAGTQVLFNGIPAPLLYVSEGQLNALVPYGISGTAATVSVQVNTSAGNSLPATVHVAVTQPQVLRNGSKALAFNQDGTLNSLADPAAPGSVVTIFASGGGLPRNPLPDGSLAGPPTLPTVGVPAFPVAVLYGDRSVEVLYAGTAPGLVANLLQVNLRLPSRLGDGFRLLIGDQFSEYFGIH